MTESTNVTPITRAKRPVRRGPPGVRCPSCNKLAGNADEGEIENYNAEVDGNEDSLTVTITCELYMTTACCGEQFKVYNLEGSNDTDHQCDVVTERDTAQNDWAWHLAHRTEEGDCECTEEDPDEECVKGTGLQDKINELNERIDNDGTDWTLTEDGEGTAEPYERSEDKDRNGKLITNYRFRKGYRGITTDVTAQHALCEGEESLTFEMGMIEAGAGDFEATA